MLFRSPKFQTTPGSKKEINDLLLSSKIRAELAGLANIRLEYVHVQADDGHILLEGKVKSRELSEQIVKTAEKVEGVVSVANELQIDYRYQGIDS